MLIPKILHDFAGPIASLLLMAEMNELNSPLGKESIDKMRSLLDFYRLLIDPQLEHYKVEKFLRALANNKGLSLTYNQPISPYVALVFGFYGLMNGVSVVLNQDYLEGMPIQGSTNILWNYLQEKGFNFRVEGPGYVVAQS